MGDEKVVVKNRVDAAGMLGPLWVMGWLFTIGWLHLAVLKAVLAIVLWPYYIGVALRH
jgi:hypothetical protein